MWAALRLRGASVDHHDATPRANEHQRRAESGEAATDDGDVPIDFHVANLRRIERRLQSSCRFGTFLA